MSVQLILYPQSYNGQYNAVSNVASEKLVDGITFNSINLSSSYDGSVSLYDSITNAPPTIINTWYRFRSTATGTPALPTESSGDLELYSTTTLTISGVYQRLSTLVVGQIYNVHILLDNSASGEIIFTAYNGNLVSSVIAHTSYTISSLVGNFVTFQFTAATTQDFIQVTYTNSVAQTFTITNISVLPYFVTPTFTNFSLEDGQVICDLYQEEDIPLTLSVDEFKNVAEKVQSYSKDFNLPATKRNNLIFDNIFEITRSDDGVIFNPYIKTQCVLKQEGYILFEGYLRLIDVQDQAGEISYNVNLYSEAVALADVLKDRTFADLDFTELEHEYNKTQIKYSWNDGVTVGQTTPITWENANTSGYRTDFNTLKYPFVNWIGQILLAGNSNTNNATVGYPELADLNNVFRPFINLKYLINRIFEDTPFTWNSTLFDSADFGKLYMDFNWGSDNVPVVFNNSATSGFPNYISYTAGANTVDFPFTSIPSNFGYSAGVFTAQADNQIYDITYNIQMMSAAGGPYTVVCKWLDSTGNSYNIQTLTPVLVGGGSTAYSGSFSTIPLSSGDTLSCIFTVASGTITILENQTTSFTGTTSAFNTTNETILETLRGGLGQWEFLKGILTMFNLVSMPDKENPLNIIFEPYADVFIDNADSKQLDWTDKVDVSEMKLLPLTDLNKQTIFKFVVDDSDYAFNLYKKSTQNLYGSKKYDASAYTILEGEDEIIATPFAASIPMPLAGQFPDFIIPAIFTSNDEATEFEGFENSPRIMYNNGKQLLLGGVTYYIPEQNGLASENQANFLQFSHLSNIPTLTGTLDFNFDTHQLINPIGNSVPNNLFNLYWLPYYNELYNPNTRIMTMKVNLTPADINTFMFYDKVMIKNREFRVNKINYKPNNLATVEFILIP